MIGMLKYGCGMPFNRLERLERAMEIPLPTSTQWDVVARAAELLAPAYAELIRQAAQGKVLHNDDTTDRTGVFTTGIVSVADGLRIALFFTGRQHAGENLADVPAQRAAELSPPIQMCDALSRNTAGDFQSVVANCVAHARRGFVEVADHFPDECRYVLETVRDVYCNDALARTQSMTPDERMAFHQARSGPLMSDLHCRLEAQFSDHKVEPNSSLGGAIEYMLKHWEKLTLFLRQPGAPLDNNVVERSLKMAILHRKNALFYKTENGAHVGDLFTSLIHTAELLGVNAFDYLVALQRHNDDVSDNPERWMPWNFSETMAALQPGPPPEP